MQSEGSMIYMGFPRIGLPPVLIYFLYGIFHNKNHPFLVPHDYGNINLQERCPSLAPLLELVKNATQQMDTEKGASESLELI